MPQTYKQNRIMQKQLVLQVLRLLVSSCLSCLALFSPANASTPTVITLAPHITELIFAAGAGKQIKATVNSSDYPAKARRIPRIGDGVNINAETLLTIQPDIVIAWLPTQAVQALRPNLQAANIQLLFSTPRTLDEVPLEILRFGKLFHSQEAEKNARALQSRINTLRETYAHRSLVRVYIDLGAEPLYTLGNDPLLNHVLSICRGVNVYAGMSVAAPLVSLESILTQRPDAVVIASSSASKTEQRRKYWRSLGLSAAIQGNTYSANPDLLFRPGPRLVDAAEQLCSDLDKARNGK